MHLFPPTNKSTEYPFQVPAQEKIQGPLIKEQVFWAASETDKILAASETNKILADKILQLLFISDKKIEIHYV